MLHDSPQDLAEREIALVSSPLSVVASSMDHSHRRLLSLHAVDGLSPPRAANGSVDWALAQWLQSLVGSSTVAELCLDARQKGGRVLEAALLQLCSMHFPAPVSIRLFAAPRPGCESWHFTTKSHCFGLTMLTTRQVFGSSVFSLDSHRKSNTTHLGNMQSTFFQWPPAAST